MRSSERPSWPQGTNWSAAPREAAERHRESPLGVTALPVVGRADDPVELRPRYVADPAHLGLVTAFGHPVDHLPHVPHGTAGQAEVGDVDDRLVAELEGGQV